MMHTTYRRLLRVRWSRRQQPRGIRVFPTVALRKLFVNRLVREGRINYAVGFINSDPRNPAGLSFGQAEWVAPGGIYAKDLEGLIH